MKYSVQNNVGTSKYVVSFWDGVKAHKDGSPFFDIRVFSNKRKMQQFVRDLERAGYTL